VTKPTHIIGIDPSYSSLNGWAVLRCAAAPALVAYGEIVIDYYKTALDVLRDIEKFLPKKRRVVVAIERQYNAKNPDTTIKLAMRAGWWELAALELGHTPTLVHPKTWQAAELGMPPTTKSPQLKKASIAKAKGLYNVTVSEHVADAIMIARYCAIEIASGRM